MRLATRLIKLGMSNQGALRWHSNEKRDFFLQFEQQSKCF